MQHALICPHRREREVYGPDPYGTGWCQVCADEDADYQRKVALVRPLAAEFMARARELTEGDDHMIGTALQETTDRLVIL
jgi:hypothetical protein